MEIRYAKLDGVDGHTAGRQLLAEMYREMTGLSMPPISVTKQGKPYWEEANRHFSISHTSRHAFCVVADAPVGIDAEEMDREIDLRLADKILSAKERARWENAADPRSALLRLWVLKEAYAKCTGRGWGSYLYSTDFDPHDERVRQIDGCYVAIIENNGQLTIDN